ncbi:MAG: type II toxin-antitoxin system PemK/MazF family toxin [Propionibacteriaceae bacterium]|jgi:mRNA interferase MazF|nr:type II toxin-antitoxin system PemK/MazF family toxin [Propionibacteriaceae bacterium]
MASTNLPKQGEIWLTAFGAGKPGEPTKTRPALVLSHESQISGSVYDLVIMVPLSASLPETPTRPSLAASPSTGLQSDSVIVVRAIRAMALSRFEHRLGEVDMETLQYVRTVLSGLLDLP